MRANRVIIPRRLQTSGRFWIQSRSSSCSPALTYLAARPIPIRRARLGPWYGIRMCTICPHVRIQSFPGVQHAFRYFIRPLTRARSPASLFSCPPPPVPIRRVPGLVSIPTGPQGMFRLVHLSTVITFPIVLAGPSRRCVNASANGSPVGLVTVDVIVHVSRRPQT